MMEASHEIMQTAYQSLGSRMCFNNLNYGL
jgi:hypothetical protein